MNQGWTYEERIDRTAAGQTVLAYYVQRYRHSGEGEWRSRIESQQVFLDGLPTTPDHPLQRGQVLTYHRPPWQEPEVPLDFDQVYADEDLWVINKPSGLPVMPGGGFLENTLLGQLQRQYPTDTPVPIHRLGRGTSGLVLLGRSPLAKSELTRQMRDRQIRKFYRALIPSYNAAGELFPPQLTIQTPIGKVPHPTLGEIFAATPAGRFAQSDCQVLRQDAQTTLLEVEIFTGRPHQIRIHLAAVGYPLLGDPLYQPGGQPRLVANAQGKLPTPGDCGYKLHAFRLVFRHPRSQQPLTLECLPPSLELLS